MLLWRKNHERHKLRNWSIATLAEDGNHLLK
jgi:hypothetical protein